MTTSAGSPSNRAERVTATGWRLVGRAVSLADEIEAQLQQSTSAEDILYSARFRLRPRLGGGSALPLALAALTEAVRRDWIDAPALTADRSVSRPAARFQGLRWEPAGTTDSWHGELNWRHPHPVVPGVPCITSVEILEHPGHTRMTVRVSAAGGIASVRGTVGAGQARPTFLTDMQRTLRLAFDGSDSDPRWLHEEDIEPFVRDVLLADHRTYPVAILAPMEGGEYVVSPSEIANELVGLAHVYVIDRHPTTFRLTDTLGDRRLSCYWGALRVYLPDFSCADRPDDHPLLMADRLADPVIRADLVGKLSLFARQFVEPPAAPATARDHEASPPPLAPVDAAETTPATLADEKGLESSAAEPIISTGVAGLPSDVGRALASVPTLLAGLSAQIGALAATIAHLANANAGLRDEVERLRTTNAIRAGSTTSLERRLRSVEGLLQQHLSPGDSTVAAPHDQAAESPVFEEDDDERGSLVETLRQAAVAHASALLVLDAAERSAADSPYEDTDRLAATLDAMAGVARRRQDGALGVSLKEAFRELGIDYRGGISSATSNKQLRQYAVRGASGDFYDCREHIVLGTSYDPRFCLRIYFTSRAPMEARFVIGHVGRHFDVATTS